MWRPARAAFLFGLLLGLAFAPLSGSAEGQVLFGGPKKEKESPLKNLTGQVVNKEGKGIAQAVVYLKDKKKMEIITHVCNDKGEFHFPDLDPKTDYEVHAELNGASSDNRSISSIDGRKDLYFVLEMGAPK